VAQEPVEVEHAAPAHVALEPLRQMEPASIRTTTPPSRHSAAAAGNNGKMAGS
jgi:hypothetical protein